MALFGRFRTKERDIEADVARIGPLIDQVRHALREAETERGGLERRVAVAGMAHAHGADRLVELAAEIDALGRSAALLESIVRPETPGFGVNPPRR